MSFLITNLETLSLGYVVLPNILFMTYFIQNSRQPEAALPMILFYAALKTTPYAQRSFGKVSNPYKLLKNGLVITILGSIVTLLHPLIIEGAILIGIGLANLPAAYLQLKDEYRLHAKWKYSRTTFLSIFYLIAAIILGMLLSKLNYNFFVVELIIILLLATVAVMRLPAPWQSRAFTGEFRFKPLIPTILILLMTIGTRGLKQTGASQLVILTLVIWLIMLLGFNWLQKKMVASRLWTFWTGAVTNFFLIYSLFFFDTLGKFSLLYAAYILYILATIISLILAKKIRSWKTIIGGSVLGLIIALIPSYWAFLVSLTITCFFCNLINRFVWPRYQADTSIPTINKRFVKQNYNILGSIASQITLICFFMINNFIFSHHTNQILAAYYLQKASPELNWVLYTTRLACIVLIIVVLSLLFVKESEYR